MDPQFSKSVQSYLHNIRSTWNATYVLQETHREIEVYLGFEKATSIVKHTFVPRTISPELGDQNIAGLSAEPTSLSAEHDTPSGTSAVTPYTSISTYSGHSPSQTLQ